jgi:DNA-binding transcriptional ArsR family regulator
MLPLIGEPNGKPNGYRSTMRRDAFQAIADPNRRAILALLAHRKLTLKGVAENFGITRPAISKHIKILAECGLVATRQRGRERYCAARLDKLIEVSDWIEQLRKVWTARLDRLDDYLNELQGKEHNRARKKRHP